jgi:hypothetical protein
MMDVLLRLEQSGFSSWVKESTSLFAFPGILLLHTIGMALVVGIAVAIDFRILGFASDLPLEPLEQFVPVLWLGFWINAATGIILLAVNVTSLLANPDFYVKIVLIVLALVNLRFLRNRIFRDPHIDKRPLSTNDRVLATTSLILWLGAIVAGRLLAYVGGRRH